MLTLANHALHLVDMLDIWFTFSALWFTFGCLLLYIWLTLFASLVDIFQPLVVIFVGCRIARDREFWRKAFTLL